MTICDNYHNIKYMLNIRIAPVLSYIFLSLLILVLLIFPAFSKAATCSGNMASVPGWIQAMPGLKSGKVALKWNLSTNIDKYGLVYGTKSGKWAKDYTYGSLWIGDEKTNSYIVGNLDPRKKYYFRLTTQCGGDASSNISKEVSSWPRQ